MMTNDLRKGLLAAGSISLLVTFSQAATIDVGWNAADQTTGALPSWAASPNNFGVTMTWDGTGTNTAGTSNFGNINRWVSSPDYNLTGGGGDSWQDANGASTSSNASWEFVFRPGDFIGNHHLFNSGGNGSGIGFLLEGSMLRFLFQNADNASQRIDISADLSGFGAATDFFHIVGTTDVDTAAAGTGQLWVNSISAAGPITSAGTIDDWDGGDLASLGSGDENHNIPTTTGYTSAAFDGDIAFFNFYGEEILSQSEINSAYNALAPIPIPEPSAALMLLISGGLTILRRKR